ncbi:unnamed protein product [Symbiodinium microadriaticum]|nr:unnamed protein product [Symbiodinium microadriaticum]
MAAKPRPPLKPPGPPAFTDRNGKGRDNKGKGKGKFKTRNDGPEWCISFMEAGVQKQMCKRWNLRSRLHFIGGDFANPAGYISGGNDEMEIACHFQYIPSGGLLLESESGDHSHFVAELNRFRHVVQIPPCAFQGTAGDIPYTASLIEAFGKLFISTAGATGVSLLLNLLMPGLTVGVCIVVLTGVAKKELARSRLMSPKEESLLSADDIATNRTVSMLYRRFHRLCRIVICRHEPVAAWSIDVKSAHKSIQVRESEQGLLGIRVGPKLFFYKVCPFGAAFSAFWFVHSKKELLNCSLGDKDIWLQISDPASKRRSLSHASRELLHFWLGWAKLPPLLRSLRPQQPLQVEAAADAMGNGSTFAIGGYIALPSGEYWFSEGFSVSDFAFADLPLKAEAHKDISCYECLGQIALVWLLSTLHPMCKLSITLRTWCDNSGIHLDVQHIPGDKNVEADYLNFNWVKNMWFHYTGAVDVGGRTCGSITQGRVQPIASRVLMKVLFAARMARIDPELDEIRYGERLDVHLLSFAWMQQQFEKGHFGMINMDTLEQVADIFTKAFSERGKWEHALMLINHVYEERNEQPAEKPGRDAQAQAKLFGKSERLCEEMSNTKAAKKSTRLRIDSNHNGFYQVYGAWTHGGMQGVTRSITKFPMVTKFLNELIRLSEHLAYRNMLHMSSEVKVNALHQKETSLACVALSSFDEAGGNSRPCEAMDYSQQIGEFWQRQLWAGVIASENLSLQEDVEHSEIKALYQYMPVQAATSNMFDPELYPCLRELCTLDNEGMSQLMPVTATITALVDQTIIRPKPTVAEHKEHPTIDHEQPDPWEDEWFEVKREETHAAMPNITTEELAAAVEKREVTRVDQYRWARVDEERAAKRARKEKRLADLARSEDIDAKGAANLRRYNDCLDDFAEMTGATLHDYWNSSPSKDEADGYLVVNQADVTGGLPKPKIDHGVRNFITGLVRGNFMDKGAGGNRRVKRVTLGLGALLEMTFDAEEIAVGWLSPYTSAELDEFDEALRETTRDAAFSILADAMEPGHSGSGKAHNYFSGEPLDEASVKSGVRANLPIEIVFDTQEILQAGCEIFVTESDGFLTADGVPGHTIVYINDGVKDVNLWSRTGGTCAATDEAAAGSQIPAKAEVDQPANFPAEASASHEDTTDFLRPPIAEAVGADVPISYDEVPYVPVETKEDEPTAEADEPMPSVEERPIVAEGMLIVPTELTTTTSHISSSSVVHIVQDVVGRAVHSVSDQKVKPPEPIIYGGTESKPVGAFLELVKCCHCNGKCLECQRICFSCGGPVKPGSLNTQNRRTQLARGREALIDQLAAQNDAAGGFLGKVKSASKDVAGRGLASFKGKNIRKAKLSLGKEDLCVAGLTSTPYDTPIAFTWYGAFLSHQDFVKNRVRCETDVHLQTFGHGYVDIRGNDPTLINENLCTVVADDMEYASQAAADARAAADRSRQAQPKYADRLPPWQCGKEGKGGKGAPQGKGKGKQREPQRPPRGEADWSWTRHQWSDREWTEWMNAWHGWTQRAGTGADPS